MNQALAFGLLGAGGLFVTSAITGSSLGDLLKGKPAHVGTTGATLASGGVAGAGAVATGTVAKTLALAQSLIGSPYNQGGHSAAINETIAQVKQLGTDCSGYVSDLMGPNGLGIWSTAQATPGIPSAPGIQSGVGQQITLWNNPAAGNAGHVWVQFGSGAAARYFEDAGGIGVHEMTASQAQSYLNTNLYQPFHPAGY